MKSTLITLALILSVSTGMRAEQPPTQYLIPHENNKLTTPAVATQPPGVTIEIRPYNAPPPTKIQTIRAAFGGSVPYVVVTADRENFVITSQEGDVLVIGCQHPHRVIINPEQYVLTTTELGAAIVVSSTAAAHIEQIDKLTITPQLPAWLPAELLKSRTDYNTAETVFSPNQRLAFLSGGTVEIAGITYKKYQFPIKN